MAYLRVMISQPENRCASVGIGDMPRVLMPGKPAYTLGAGVPVTEDLDLDLMYGRMRSKDTVRGPLPSEYIAADLSSQKLTAILSLRRNILEERLYYRIGGGLGVEWAHVSMYSYTESGVSPRTPASATSDSSIIEAFINTGVDFYPMRLSAIAITADILYGVSFASRNAPVKPEGWFFNLGIKWDFWAGE